MEPSLYKNESFSVFIVSVCLVVVLMFPRCGAGLERSLHVLADEVGEFAGGDDLNVVVELRNNT